MADKTYVVTAACAVVYNADRSAAVTVRKGGTVPRDADPAHVKLLLERGLIEKGESTGGVQSDPDAAPPFTPQTAPTPTPASTTEGEAPAGNASRDEWAAYALTQDGVTEDDIKDLGRDDLRERFGPREG